MKQPLSFALVSTLEHHVTQEKGEWLHIQLGIRKKMRYQLSSQTHHIA